MTQMTSFICFKVTFLAITAGLTAGLIIKGLFDADLGDMAAIGNLIFKSLIISIAAGAVLGLLNAYFKIGFTKKQTGCKIFR
ncbi:MAG: hypothetical protein EA364_09310 [Balneolaceae bacterium]|nr:MAG: hypothetical protein EA364_09310 [Balneolaceae bacterium]